MGKLPPLPDGVTSKHVAALVQIFREDVPPVIFDIATGDLSKIPDPSPALNILHAYGFVVDGQIDPNFKRAAQLATNDDPIHAADASSTIHEVALDVRVIVSCPGAGMTFADWFAERAVLHRRIGGSIFHPFDMFLQGLALLVKGRRRDGV